MKSVAISPSSVRPSRGFTLIELLVVIAIIAMLAAGVVGGYGKVMKMFKNKAAQQVCVQVAGSIQNYFGEYDTLPDKGEGGDFEGDTKAGAFIGVLADANPQDSTKNPKHIKFLEGLKQAKRGSNGLPQDGIDLDTDPTMPTIWDPWGQEYKVVMDTDFNGEIENPDNSDTLVKKIRGKKAIVYSAGADGNWETWNDNAKSW